MRITRRQLSWLCVSVLVSALAQPAHVQAEPEANHLRFQPLPSLEAELHSAARDTLHAAMQLQQAGDDDVSSSDNPCAYYVGQNFVNESSKGLAAAFCIIALVGLALIGVSYWNFFYNHWDKVEFEKLPQSSKWDFKRSYADYFRQFTLFMDAIQVCALVTTPHYAFNFWGLGTNTDGSGLGFRALHTSWPQDAQHVFRSLLKIFIFDFDELAFWNGKHYNDAYWSIIVFCFILTLMFAFIFTVIYFQLDKFCIGGKFGQYITHSLVILGPFFGNVLFIPIVSNFLGAFSCMKQRRPTTLDTFTPFLARDCSLECWTGAHNNYVGVATVGLAIYLPLSFFGAPIWQMLPDSLTIKDQPKFVMVQMQWKLFYCMSQAFFIQFPIVHSICMLNLSALLFFLSVWWQPTTLPYFDLVVMAFNAEQFWCSIAVVTGLFLPGKITLAILGSGCILIMVEFFILNSGRGKDEGGRYAKDSIDWHNHRKKMALEQQLKELEKQRRLKETAKYNRRVLMASNPRDVPPLPPSITSGDIKIDIEDMADLEDVKFVDRYTGRTVTVKGILNKKKPVVKFPKVMGLKLDTPIPSQFPMSFKLRPDNTGTLLIMRSPDATLKKYLDLKVNAYQAHHTAYRYPAPPEVDKSEKELEREQRMLQADDEMAREPEPISRMHSLSQLSPFSKKRKNSKTFANQLQVYCSQLEGPSHDILPFKEEVKEAAMEPYMPVNNASLLAILQNCGTEERSFQAHIVYHSMSLGEWIQKNKSSATRLGKEFCNIFKVEPFVPVHEHKVYDDKYLALKKKLDDLKDMYENMENEFSYKLQVHMQKKFAEGRATGRKEYFAKQQLLNQLKGKKD